MSYQTDELVNILVGYGATPAEITELLAYCQNPFSSTNLPELQTVPLASEPHLAAWERYYSQAQEVGVFTALRSALVQLQFPIQDKISQTDNYRAATRKGYLTEGMVEATGLELEKPEELQLIIHQTLAGKIPVIIAGCRADFITFVQALTKRNEPEPIPDSMGATIVAGFNNWERIRHYRQEWEAKLSTSPTDADWQAEFQRLKLQKHLYQDCFIILSRGKYSGISAEEIGIDKEEWLRLSLIIRLEHECCHYFTRRMFGSMRNNMLDELIADYQGIVAANGGRYRADWFLRFIGLEAFPEYRQGGRLQNYRGQPPLSDGAFKILQVLVKDAAENLEKFNSQPQGELYPPELQAKLLASFASLTLVKLAADQGIKL
ncbi:hypothetical protein QUA00_18740 [Microcoleus sp. T2B6]|uniref:DUF7005 family protein n=1 Tax=Microcoleus sp. T2B6 TaxID=3055424 RepID=UPI002FD2BD04